ncbi:MAG: FAD-binding domain-containing protein, partial [Vulcanimicrobiaceae bacterium]
EAGFAVRIVHDAPAVSPEQIVAARAEDPGGYRSFAAFASAWEAQPRQPSTVALRFAAHDVVGEAPPQARGECNGVPSSEGTALAAFERYLERAALGYLAARRVPSAGATAHLAAPLSHGVLSARRVLERLEQRAGDRFLLAEERLSLRALRESLVRRDFFLQLAWCFEREPDAVLVAAMRDFRWARSHPALAAWREGRTGIPLVDAGMRELRASGWMHPRIRAVVASFLCFDMGLDWRIGRDAWEAELIEDEPALASGNWQWIAGIGADPVRLPRIYNPWKQARIHDPEGKYVRRWIPELAERPLGDRFDLRAAAVAQLRLQLFEDTYPAPLVDHDRAARAFLRRYGEHLRRPG